MLSKFEVVSVPFLTWSACHEPRAPSSVPAYTAAPTTDPDALKDKSHQKGEDVNDSGMIIDDPPSKAKAKPVSRARLPNSTSTMASLPPLPSKPILVSNKPKSAQKPKSTSSRTLLPQSRKQEASDSDTSSRVRPR
ncbi:hypothetical protein BKA83DRAFT_684699, partial [Pisolithus microcarpus]